MNISELDVMPAALAADDSVATGNSHESADQPTHLLVQGRAVETAERPVLSFIVPPEDREFFTKRIGHHVQREVNRTLALLQSIHAGGNIEGGCKRVAAQLARELNSTVPPRGFSARTLERKLRDFMDGCERVEGGRTVYYERGDWRMFWDKAKWPLVKTGAIRRASDCVLSPAFIQFLRANHDNNQRGVFAQWYTELIHIWRTHYCLNSVELPDIGKRIKAGQKVPHIPGYSAWPVADAEGRHPEGWSLSNLQRKCERDEKERALVTIGRAAAKHLAFKVPGTRVGSRLLQFVFGDDHEFNQKIIIPRQPFMRPRGFAFVDLLTAFPFHRYFKPTLWDAELSQKKALKEIDFLFSVLSWLRKVGYRKDEVGTTLVGEHGLSIIREPFKSRLLEATNGKFRFEAGGRSNERGHVGQLHPVDHTKPDWRNKGRGNPRSKPLIEQTWALVDNAFGSLPGQVGKSRDFCPEQQDMIEKECEQLLCIAETLSPEQAALLEFPQLNWWEWCERASTLFTLIGRSHRHQIEGWERCGFITSPLSDSNGRMVEQARPFSREEAFLSRMADPAIARLPLSEWPGILGVENCYRANGEDTVLVQEDVITIKNREWTDEPDAVQFVAVDYHGNLLRNGWRYRAYLNPADLSVLVLTDEDNRPIAECQRVARVQRWDVDAVREAQGKAAHLFAKTVREVDARHAAAGMSIAQRYEHNANVAAGRDLRLEAREQAIEQRVTEQAREEIVQNLPEQAAFARSLRQEAEEI